MNKPFVMAGVLIMASVMFCGCGDLPKMTNEQSEVVTEYASSLLLKYDSTKHSRLIDTDAFLEKYNKAWDEYNEAKAEYEKQLAKEEKKKKKEQQKEESKEEVIDRSESDNSGTGGATVIDTLTIGQFLGVNYDISYMDYSLVKTYPEDGTDFFFSMDATSGHDLLIVKLNATNMNSESDELDVMSKNLTFKLSINNEGFHAAYKTMLDDDLSEYVGNFNVGESKTLVLIGEVESGKAINSIDLRISDTKGNVVTKQLMK
ncbi:MAG: hypothetical protein MJ123_04130 [Lachnospiraceae bacterium]|nr:hypothetical protein [Lachnospiraceae bacterium]